MNPKTQKCLLTFAALQLLAFLVGSTSAQIIPTGVVNVPEDLPAIGDRAYIRSGTTLNLNSGGSIGNFVEARSGSEVNIFGGSVGGFFEAHSGSVVTVSGGTIERDFSSSPGSLLTVTGGDFSWYFASGGTLDMSGGSVVTARLGGTANLSGGNLGRVSANGELNITGGTVRLELQALNDAVINISGGTVGGELSTFGNTVINLSGGTVGTYRAFTTGQLNIFGGEFFLNEVAVTTPTLTFADEDLLTGILEDGSPFVFTGSELNYRAASGNGVTLISSSLPELERSPIIVDDLSGPRGIRAGQTLNLREGGILKANFAAVDATLNVRGGLVEGGLEVVGSEVNISGGLVSNHNQPYQAFEAYAGSVINLSGGTIGNEGNEANFNARPGSIVNISGGLVDGTLNAFSDSKISISGGIVGDERGFRKFNARAGSEINISGGLVRSELSIATSARANISGGTLSRRLLIGSGSEVNVSGGKIASSLAGSGSIVNISGGATSYFEAYSASKVNVAGGIFGNRFNARPGSEVTLAGGEFLLNGSPLTTSTVTLSDADILTGTLQNGSPFIFTPLLFDSLDNVVLVPTLLPQLDKNPIVVDSNNSPTGLRSGQKLILREGGLLGENFEAVQSTIHVEGGIAAGFEVVDSELNISGGEISTLRILPGSKANISGGRIGTPASNSVQVFEFDIYSNGVANITGGVIDSYLNAKEGSVLNVSGGHFSRGLNARAGSEVNIFGGNIGDDLDIFDGGRVILVGTEFVLNGQRLDFLAVGESHEILDREVELSGLLSDGTPFSYELATHNRFGRSFVSQEATLMVRLVPEPTTLSLMLLGAVACRFLWRRWPMSN